MTPGAMRGAAQGGGGLEADAKEGDDQDAYSSKTSLLTLTRSLENEVRAFQQQQAKIKMLSKQLKNMT
jgi:hypothetical protein